jgi:fermentation-respiration switch protein FrsA (DUF1100 family)
MAILGEPRLRKSRRVISAQHSRLSRAMWRLTAELQQWTCIVPSKQLCVLLLAACLTGCGGYTMFDSSFTSAGLGSGKSAEWQGAQRNTSTGDDPDSTGSSSAAQSSASAGKNDPDALNSLFARAAQSKANEPKLSQTSAPVAPAEGPVAKPIALADARDVPQLPPQAGTKVSAAPRGRAYLFRGIAGLIYSRGMDKLAERIRSAGIPASVDTYLVWRSYIDQAIRDYRRDPQPIILIGHSMGGDAALAFAETLNAADIPVSLLVTYDPSRIADDVPPNVERYINIFQSSNIMGGGNVVQGTRFHGHYASYNLKNHSEIIHINIEKADRIQEQLVSKVVELATTPATTEGEAVPLHLEVPADAAVELWDSGMPVAVHAGDTLKTVADTYHVPLWSLTEINGVSSRLALSEGQRIIVPRHLVPMTPSATVTSSISSYAPVGR